MLKLQMPPCPGRDIIPSGCLDILTCLPSILVPTCPFYSVAHHSNLWLLLQSTHPPSLLLCPTPSPLIPTPVPLGAKTALRVCPPHLVCEGLDL